MSSVPRGVLISIAITCAIFISLIAGCLYVNSQSTKRGSLDTTDSNTSLSDSHLSRDQYLRVTEILYPFSGLQAINPDVVAYAAERGTKVHKICEAIMSGLGELGVDDETWGYVESFKKWWQDGKPIKELERRFWCDQWQITGQVDMIVDTPEGLAIVDIKTSSKPSKTWRAQGEAYYYLATQAGYDIQKIYFLHLNKHGKEPRLYEYKPDFSFFFACLAVFRHFYQKGTKAA